MQCAAVIVSAALSSLGPQRDGAAARACCLWPSELVSGDLLHELAILGPRTLTWSEVLMLPRTVNDTLFVWGWFQQTEEHR